MSTTSSEFDRIRLRPPYVFDEQMNGRRVCDIRVELLLGSIVKTCDDGVLGKITHVGKSVHNKIFIQIDWLDGRRTVDESGYIECEVMVVGQAPSL